MLGVKTFTFVCYVVILGKSIEIALTRGASTSKKHIEVLESLGMKVNINKTEVMVFRKNKQITRIKVRIGTILLDFA